MTGQLYIEIIEGPDAGRMITVEEPLDVGREGAGGLVLADRLVSRRHARFVPVDDALTVEDLDSSNGTLVNGAQVHAAVRVMAGDHVQVGSTVLLVRSEDQVALQPTMVRPVPPALAAQARKPDYVPPQAISGPAVPELEPLLDIYTKARARTAPLAVFALVVLAVIIALALR
jgi:pSer/pThr/pTyr-binding forkhead associated (FHA) protein